MIKRFKIVNNLNDLNDLKFHNDSIRFKILQFKHFKQFKQFKRIKTAHA